MEIHIRAGLSTRRLLTGAAALMLACGCLSVAEAQDVSFGAGPWFFKGSKHRFSQEMRNDPAPQREVGGDPVYQMEDIGYVLRGRIDSSVEDSYLNNVGIGVEFWTVNGTEEYGRDQTPNALFCIFRISSHRAIPSRTLPSHSIESRKATSHFGLRTSRSISMAACGSRKEARTRSTSRSESPALITARKPTFISWAPTAPSMFSTCGRTPC